MRSFTLNLTNTENIKYLNRIVSFYCKNYEDQVQAMRDTSHHMYEDDVIKNHNPWHGEGDVWSHVTAMIGSYKSYLGFNTTHIETVEDLITMTVAILTHDYGKIFTRKEVPPSKVTFYNHAFLSTKHAMNVIYDVLSEFCVDTTKQSTIITNVCDLVSNHMVFYDMLDNPEKTAKMVRYDISLYAKFKLFKNIDEFGSVISKDSNSNKAKTPPSIKNSNHTIPHPEDVNIMFYCGLPGSGKDFLAKSHNRKIFSFDNIRLNIFKDYIDKALDERIIINNSKDMSSKAFDYCLSKKIQLEPLLLEEINNEIKYNGFNNKLAVCNTNLKKDSRKVLVNYLKNRYKDITIGCTFIILSEDTCKANDTNRSDHTVGEEVFNHMRRIEIPTYIEHFDLIQFKTSYDV